LRHQTKVAAALSGLVAIFAVVAASPDHAHAGIFKLGAEIFVPISGDVTAKSTQTDEFVSDGAQDKEEEFDESTALGFTFYGTVGFIPFLDVGLVFYLIPDLRLSDQDKIEYPVGSATDLNLRIGTSIPLPAVDISIYGEGGLTLFGITDEPTPEACTGGGVNSRLCQIYERDAFEDDTSPIGFNAGAGFMLRYGVVPFFGFHGGMDFHFYSFQVFNGSNSSNNTVLTEDLSGTRFRLFFGVDFDL
jgi:hypothetical protein